MKHIFLLHSQYQIGVAEDVIKMQSIPKSSAIAILEGENLESILDEGIWGVAVALRPSLGRKVGRGALRIANEAVTLARRYGDRNAALYVSDLCWAINNHVAYALAKQNFQVFLIEDGIGAYVEQRIGPASALKALIRMTLGQLKLGPRHTPFLGRFLGQDSPIVKGSFVYRPDKLDDKKKIHNIAKHKLPPTSASAPLDRDAMLVLGQPLSLIFKPHFVPLAEQAIITEIEKHTAKQRYYKGHPNDKSGRTAIASACGEILKNDRTAEQAFEEKRFGHIISFHCSALINVKDDNPEVNCVAIVPKDKSVYKTREAAERTESVLRRSGVRIIEF